MAYLTLDVFQQLGGDSTVTVDAFAMHAARAERLIDRATHDRLKRESEPPEAVKYCMYSLIQAMLMDEQHGGREIASVSNDGMSVTYATAAGGSSSAPAQHYLQIIRTWLDGETTSGGVPLLYAGVDA